MGKVLAVDPGEKRIGVALGDEQVRLARGLGVISHISLQDDCTRIVQLAKENGATLILVGNPVGEDGEERPQTRHSQKMAAAIAELSEIKVELWDESGSTALARANSLEAGFKRSKRQGHLDASAAAVILQSWFDRKGEGNF